MNPQQFNLLVVDDEIDITSLVQDILEDEGYHVNIANNAEKADKIYLNQSIDLVLLDIWMPKEDGLSLLNRWCENGLKSEIIMMSGHGTIETAVQATKLGAFDFIEKPISMVKLMITVENAIKKIKLEQRQHALIKQINPDVQIIGKSPVINDLKQKLNQVKNKILPVTFIGSPGVGKTHYARYLHQISNRNTEPFIVVNASSLSRENQLEEIFGTVQKSGLLQTADGGTLFIDEVADLERETQAIFEEVLETGFIRRNGKQIKQNVRFCFSSKYSLSELSENKKLNEKFYLQISTLTIFIPQLNNYQDDIPEIISHYVYEFVDYDNLPYRNFSMQALNYLREHQWNGNVRELRNFIQRALVMGEKSEISLAEAQHLLKLSEPNTEEEKYEAVSIDLPIRDARERFERAYFMKQLKFCEGNIAKLADRAGLERTNLYRKLKSLDIEYK